MSKFNNDFSNAEILTNESILRVGEVFSVEGRVVRVLVDKVKNASHLLFKGKALKNVSVGGYIKIMKGFEVIICKIEGEFSEEARFNKEINLKSGVDTFQRYLRVGMVGFYSKGVFKKGIREMPLVGNACFLLNDQEVNEIHAFSTPEEKSILVGSLASDKSMKIRVGVDSLFASHIGIFGNTGSGKSYTLASLYYSLFRTYKKKNNFKKNARFFLIDFNGEYAQNEVDDFFDEDRTIVEENSKVVFRLSTRLKSGSKFPISVSALNDVTLWTLLLEATDKTQVPFLRRSVENKYIQKIIENEKELKAFLFRFIVDVTSFRDKSLDKGLIVNFLKELEEALGEKSGLEAAINYFESKLEFFTGNNTYYFREDKWVFSDKDEFKDIINTLLSQSDLDSSKSDGIQKLRLKILLNYYNEIIRGFSNKDHLAPLIKRLGKRFEDIGKVFVSSEESLWKDKNLAIVSLKDVNLQMRKVLPLLFAKHLYEEQKRNSNGKNYLNLIIDEAHNVLSPSSNRESEQWKDYRLETFEEIIKEGRKFGVFLTIASQRPSDISTTIISQLHNYFIHRLINNKDIEAVERNLSYMDKTSIETLPILATGVCVLAGIAAQMPVIIEVEAIEHGFTPHSETIKPTSFWE